jgi:hypothetical protein
MIRQEVIAKLHADLADPALAEVREAPIKKNRV